jgi:peptide/nickel transport system ATP-binding protein
VRGATPTETSGEGRSELLRVEDEVVEIRTRRGVLRAVDGVSFTIARGEALGLVGESGCGKTTTMRAILGLLPRTATCTGRILFEGEDLNGRDKTVMRRRRGKSISMIFQEPMTALNPVMRAGNQIAEAIRINTDVGGAEADREALDLMKRVGIPDAERRFRAYPHELSGGMRQRVMIAMALSCHPRLVLCDEPTTALDVTVQEQILNILSTMRREEDLSVLYVTHDLAVVSELCDRVAVMYAAQIVEVGTVDEVFRRPRHPYTLGLLRSIPRFERVQEMLNPIPGAPPHLMSPPSGCRFHPRCPYVQDDCKQGAFPLLPVGEGHVSACIHSEECVEAVRAMPVLADD